MIIGYDKGATATKLVAVKGEELLGTLLVQGRETPEKEAVEKALEEWKFSIKDVEKIAATGVGAEGCCFDELGICSEIIPEIEATGEGGLWLAKLNEGIVVSIGTGTAIALGKDGVYTHVGGSGVGSGTLRGFSKKIFGTEDVRALFELAENGNRRTVDIMISDLFSGTDTLPPDLTAANLAKASDGAAGSDWAKALINMVLEVAGSHAALACNGFGVKNVVITGGVSVTPIAKEVYDGFTRLYGLNYVIPPYSDFATAIGAARSRT